MTSSFSFPRKESLRAREIGVLFDIDELERADYGRAAWSVFMKSVDPIRLSDCILFSGDTTIPGNKVPHSFCIGIEYLVPAQSDYFRNVFSNLNYKGLFPAERRLIDGRLSKRFSLPVDGFIDGDGRFRMSNTGALWMFIVAAETGWRYLPSDDWLGEFAVEYLKRTAPNDPLGVLGWDARFIAVAKQALREAGQPKTMLAAQYYLDNMKDVKMKQFGQNRIGELQRLWLAEKTPVRRLVIVGLGFQPSHEDLKSLIRLWQNDFPDYPTTKCLITSTACPSVKDVADLATAMRINWGDAFFERFFENDLLEGCDMKTALYRLSNEQEVGIFASYKPPLGVCQSKETELLTRRLEVKSREKTNATRAPIAESRPLQIEHPSKYDSLGPLRSLGLNVLSHQIFHTSLEGQTHISVREEEKIRRLVLSATTSGEKVDFLALDEATKDLKLRFPDFALGYLWRSVALSGLGRFDEAFELLESGFKICSNVRFLCGAFGHVFEKKGQVEQFGWYMQECFLGSDSYWTFLVLAQAALCCGNIELATRLFEASDIVCPDVGLWRLTPEGVARIQDLVEKNIATMIGSLRRFAAEFDYRLPPLDLLPEEQEARKRWLVQKKEAREIAKKKLMSGRTVT